MTSRIIAIVAIMALSLGIFAGCEKPNNDGTSETKCTVIGSDTMLNLTKNWANAYKEKNKDVEISVTGGGSGGGIKALINGTTDFAMASRQIKPEEIEDCKKEGFDVKENIMAQDGLAIIVNKSNPINEISLGELKKIFGDKNTTSWKAFNGKDEELAVFTRDSSSGTFVFFLEEVIGKDGQYRDDKLQTRTQSNAMIIDDVVNTPNGIGYVGLGYAMERKGDIKILKVKKDGGTAYEPGDDKYPLTRNLYFYTKGEPKGLVKKFIDFALSDEGQKIVAEEGFLPLKK